MNNNNYYVIDGCQREPYAPRHRWRKRRAVLTMALAVASPPRDILPATLDCQHALDSIELLLCGILYKHPWRNNCWRDMALADGLADVNNDARLTRSAASRALGEPWRQSSRCLLRQCVVAYYA